MPCTNPKWAWKSTLPNENGRHPLSFAFRHDRTADYRIPCGKCDGCHAARKRDWGIRIFHEAQCYQQNSFLTLTYNDQNLPEDGKINKRDIDIFIKRLKRRCDTNDIRYFVTGEYGEKTRRPHYHAIIFGQDFLGGAFPITDKLYGNPLLSNRMADQSAAWTHGEVAIAEFTIASAMYVSGYVQKKSNDNDTFSIMSKRPPIGRTWVQSHHDNFRRLESIQIEGKSYPIPGVYLKWLEGVEEFNHIKENRRSNVIPMNEQALKSTQIHYDRRNENKRESI